MRVFESLLAHEWHKGSRDLRTLQAVNLHYVNLNALTFMSRRTS